MRTGNALKLSNFR